MPKAPRTDRYAGHVCAVGDCGKQTRVMSRYCLRHARQLERVRNPLGRFPKKSELTPWRELCSVALVDWGMGEHPRVKALEAWFAALVASADRLPSRYTKHARHLSRLHSAGIPGRAMLLRVMAVVGLQHLGVPGSYGVDLPCYRATIGNALLRSGPLDRKPADWVTGKRGDAIRPAGTVCEDVGEAVLAAVGAHLLTLWRDIEAERIRRESPLVIPSTP